MEIGTILAVYKPGSLIFYKNKFTSSWSGLSLSPLFVSSYST